METITTNWEFYATNERNHNYGSILHSYDNYVAIIDDQNELGNIVGNHYFCEEVCIDEIMEMFNVMSLSGNASMMHYVSFVIFLMKKSLFNKMITLDEFKITFQKYMGKCTPLYEQTNGKSFLRPYKFKQETSDFVKNLANYNKDGSTDEDNDMVYDNLYKLMIDCKY